MASVIVFAGYLAVCVSAMGAAMHGAAAQSSRSNIGVGVVTVAPHVFSQPRIGREIVSPPYRQFSEGAGYSWRIGPAEQFFGVDPAGSAVLGKPFQAIDPSMLPRLKFEEGKGLTAGVDTEEIVKKGWIGLDSESLSKVISEMELDYNPLTEKNENLKWFATNLTGDENMKLNKYIEGYEYLKPEEMRDLESILNKSMPIPYTPVPQPPIFTGGGGSTPGGGQVRLIRSLCHN